MSRSLETLEQWDLFLLTQVMSGGRSGRELHPPHLDPSPPLLPSISIHSTRHAYVSGTVYDGREAQDAGGEAWPSLWSPITQLPVLWGGTYYYCYIRFAH